jgi:hypothetical protein
VEGVRNKYMRMFERYLSSKQINARQGTLFMREQVKIFNNFVAIVHASQHYQLQAINYFYAVYTFL